MQFLMGDRDPIFDLPMPLLFAHRGGAREKPESTEMALRWAIDKARVEVLEIDVQLTKDKAPVLWHGPDLDNVLIRNQPSEVKERKRLNKREIGDFTWKELEDSAWVADPRDDPEHKFTPEELEAVPRKSDRMLLRLETVLEMYSDHHLNVEIKPQTFDPVKVKKLAEILDQNWEDGRRILVTSRKKSLLRAFREFSTKDFPTGYSLWELLKKTAQAKLPFPFENMSNRALQTSYVGCLSSEQLVAKVKQAGGAVHIFLTGFWIIGGLDELPGAPSKEALDEILKRGVHGIMTDRPYRVRTLM